MGSLTLGEKDGMVAGMEPAQIQCKTDCHLRHPRPIKFSTYAHRNRRNIDYIPTNDNTRGGCNQRQYIGGPAHEVSKICVYANKA